MGDPACKAVPDEHLDDTLEHGDAWEQQIDRCIADVREGRVELLEHEDVMAEIDRMLAVRGVRSTRARARQSSRMRLRHHPEARGKLAEAVRWYEDDHSSRTS